MNRPIAPGRHGGSARVSQGNFSSKATCSRTSRHGKNEENGMKHEKPSNCNALERPAR